MSDDNDKRKKRKKKDKPMFSWEKHVEDNMNAMRDQSLNNMMEASERRSQLAQLKHEGLISQIQARQQQALELFSNMTNMKSINMVTKAKVAAKSTQKKVNIKVKATKIAGKTVSASATRAATERLKTGKRGNILVDEDAVTTKRTSLTEGAAVKESFYKQKERLKNTNEVKGQYKRQGNVVPDSMKSLLWAQLMQLYADCAALSEGPGAGHRDPMCPQIMAMMDSGDIDGLMTTFFGGTEIEDSDGPLNAPKGRTVDTRSSGVTELNKYGITPAGSYGEYPSDYEEENPEYDPDADPDADPEYEW